MANNNNQEPTTNNTTPPTTEPTTTPQAEPQSDDDFSGKKHMAATINRLRAELADRDAKAKAAADEAERKKLEDQGKWQEIADKAKADLELAHATHAAEKRRLTLEAKLAGMHPLALRGAIADCPQDADIDAYVADIREKHKGLFDGATVSSRSTPQGMAGASTSSAAITAATAQQWIKSDDPEKVKAARQFVKNYFNDHRKHPWS